GDLGDQILNDPHTTLFRLIPYAKLTTEKFTVYKAGARTLTREELHRRISQAFSIICFSKKFDSIQMWSHYADRHAGIVLGFDESANEILSEHVREVSYRNDPILYRHTINDEEWYLHSQAIMHSKHYSWHQEEEVRLVIPNDEGFIDEKSRFKQDFVSCLKEIYFGVNCSDFDMENIALHCIQQSIDCKFFKARCDQDVCGLSFLERSLKES
ncbi:DUF2971 domain-containing protein, partial [Coraliomargarita sp. SDUM461004]